jgi:hypothetical protein
LGEVLNDESGFQLCGIRTSLNATKAKMLAAATALQSRPRGQVQLAARICFVFRKECLTASMVGLTVLSLPIYNLLSLTAGRFYESDCLMHRDEFRGCRRDAGSSADRLVLPRVTNSSDRRSGLL